MKHIKNIWIGLAVIVVAVLLIIVVVNKKSGQNRPDSSIKIGAVLSLTGMASQDGESIKNGMELALKELKKEGYSVEVNYQDDATDPKKTIGGIQYLSSWGAQGIVGPTWSFLGSAGAPALDAAKMVGFQPANTSEYTQSSEYAFFGAVKISEARKPLEKFFTDHEIKTIAFIGNNGEWDKASIATLREAAKNAGAEIVFTEFIPYGNEVASVNTLLVKVRGLNPDLVVSTLSDDQGITLLLQRIEQYQLDTTVLAQTTSLIRVLENNSNLKTGKVPVYSLLRPVAKAFNEKYFAEYGEYPGSYADTGYDGTMLLVKGISEKEKDQDLRDYLKLNTYKGVAKSYSFDDKNDVIGGEWILEKAN